MNRRIKILQVFTTLDRGGAETNFMNYLQRMDLDRFEVEVLVHRACEGAYEATLKQMGIVIHRLPAIHPFNYWVYQRQAKALLTSGQYDIIHSHMSELSVWLLKSAKELNIQTRIVHAHLANAHYDVKYPIRLYWRSQLHNYANQGFTCGTEASNWLFNQPKQWTSIYLMRNAIDIESWQFNITKRALMHTQLNCSDESINIVHVGRFNHQKNHHQLIQIFAAFIQKYPSAQIYLLGSGHLQSEIQEKVAKMGLTQQVHFIGSVSNVQDYLQAMDVMLFPSLFEGLPVSLIEAQAMGLPIVASNSISQEVAVIPELLQFVDLKAPLSEWVNAIEKALTIPRMDRGQAIKAAQYDIDTNAKALEVFYIKAASN